MVKLGLKGIEDLNNKRVQNPNEFYNSLTALYNAVKNQRGITMQFEIQKFADKEIKEYGDILDGSVEEKS